MPKFSHQVIDRARTTLPASVVIYGETLETIYHYGQLMIQNYKHHRLTISTYQSSDEDLASLSDQLQTGSLFAEPEAKQLLVSKNLTKSQEKKLLDLLALLQPEDYLLVTFLAKPNAKLIKEIRALVTDIIHCERVYANRRKQWLENCARDLDVALPSSALAKIVAAYEGDLTGCYNILKLCLVSGTDLVDEWIHGVSSQQDVFELVDACFMGKADKALRVLEQMTKSELVLVVATLAKPLGVLAEYTMRCAKVSDYHTKDQVIKELTRNGMEAARIKSAHQRLGVQSVALLESLHDIDRNIKGLGWEDARLMLENLVLKLSGSQSIKAL